jgi:hypothetical protein
MAHDCRAQFVTWVVALFTACWEGFLFLSIALLFRGGLAGWWSSILAAFALVRSVMAIRLDARFIEIAIAKGTRISRRNSAAVA